MTKVGIVLSSQFVASSSNVFSKYIDYVERTEAVRNKKMCEFNAVTYDGYNEYMSNPDKTAGLFTQTRYGLSTAEKKVLKQQFIQAQENKSVMWQDVISFDNDWLEKHGMYDKQTGHLASGRLMDSVQIAMNKLLEREAMKHSAVWSAAIHYNTDNIHVHIATVEPNPTRKFIKVMDENGKESWERRGSRRLSHLEEMKSLVANHLVNRNQQLGQLNELLREKIGSKDRLMALVPDKELQVQAQIIQEHLPRDLRKWKYNMEALKEVRPLIDEFTKIYIARYHQEDMQKFERLLDREVAFRQEMYGVGDKQLERSQDYKARKMDELYSRLGNTLLKGLAEQEKESRNQTSTKANTQGNSYTYSPRVSLFSIKKSLSKDFKQTIRNQQDYQYIINDQENDYQR